MWKLAIIDDEKLIVQGLQVLIDWQAFGIEVVCATSDPQEIIEKCQNFDFLLSDVQMPRMTGIELIETVKKINPALECVILSGYDDFAYAQKGMDVGVRNYLLKPIDEVEVQAVFQKLIAKLAEKRTYQQAVMHQFYHQLQSGTCLDVSEQLPRLAANEGYYLFSATEVFPTEALEVEMEFLFTEPKKIGICWLEQGDDEVLSELARKFPIQVFSQQGRGSDQFMQCFQNIHNVLIFDEQQTVFWQDYESMQFDRVAAIAQVEKFQHLLIQADFPIIAESLATELKKVYTKTDFDDVVIVYLLALHQFSVAHHLQWHGQLQKTMQECLQYLSEFATMEQAIQQLQLWSEAVHHEFHSKVTNYTPIIQRVMKIIDEQYTQELALKTLSQTLNMNTSYLGQVFKEEVGMSFNAYVNQIRMEKARELLLHTHLKINQIAQEVGFFDNSYFYRKFKTYYGYCPNTVRKNIRNEQA